MRFHSQIRARADPAPLRSDNSIVNVSFLAFSLYVSVTRSKRYRRCFQIDANQLSDLLTEKIPTSDVSELSCIDRSSDDRIFFLVPDKVQRDKDEEGHRAAPAPRRILPRADELLPGWPEDDRALRRVRGGLERAVAEDKAAAGRRAAEAARIEEYVTSGRAAGQRSK